MYYLLVILIVAVIGLGGGVFGPAKIITARNQIQVRV